MTRYAPYNPIALYEPGRALVLGDVNDTADDLLAGKASSTWAFIVEPINDTSSRLIVRSRVATILARLQGPAQFVMQRKMMVGIKQRAEGTWSPSIRDVIEPLTWFSAAAVATIAAWFSTRPRSHWWHPLAISGVASIVLGYLLFWQPMLAVAVVLDLALVTAIVVEQRAARTRLTTHQNRSMAATST
jgi:hypothetical protein